MNTQITDTAKKINLSITPPPTVPFCPVYPSLPALRKTDSLSVILDESGYSRINTNRITQYALSVSGSIT